MLRINLLPSSVAQRRLNKKITLGFAGLLALCIALPLLYNATLVSSLNQQRQDADAAVQGKATTDGLKQQADTVSAQVTPIKAKLDFTKAVFAYNNRLANLFYNLAEYTDAKIIYTDAVYAGNIMTIKAYSPSIAEVGRYLQRIYQDPDFTSVAIDKIPGYPDGSYYKYYVGKTLVSIATPPAGTNLPGATSNGQGGLGGPAGPGGPGGFGGPGRGGPFGPASNGPGAAGGAGGATQYGQTSQTQVSALNGLGEQVTPLATIVQRNTTPLTLPRQSAEFATQLEQHVYAKRMVQGFPFTVTVTLANPPVAPAVPGPPGTAAAAPAAAGGLGGPMGTAAAGAGG